MRAGHLFAGIDGFGLGLAEAGIETAWTAELADFPHGILQLRVPNAEHYRDVTTLKDPPAVDVLTGGFPCQDLSLAGLGAGIGGSRSGLWTEYARIIGEVSPTVVLIENVPALLSRGFELVVENLLTLGYVVEWDCLPAAAFGAPHLRDRVFVVAHRDTRPRVFGDPVGLFAHPWRDLPERGNGWRKWPRAGFVDTDGLLELAPLATIGAVRKGAVLPTPTVNDAKNLATGESQFQRNSLSLPAMAARKLWPTAVASDSLGSRRSTARTDEWTSNPGTTLLDAVSEAEGIIWPTPKSSPSGPDFARAGRDGSGGDDLATRVARSTAGALNPDWVEWLMGFPLGWTDPRVADDALTYQPWDLGEPPGIPRTSPDAEHRKTRLTALGNALVPAAAAWLGARIQPLVKEATRV